VDRRIRISIIVVVVVVLAYPAAAWLLGLSVAYQWKDREQHSLGQIPYIALVKRDYRRGIYTSTEAATYRLGSSILATLGASGHAGWADQAQFTVHSTIHHGPLPQLRAFAPATVDTQIVLPPEVRKELAAALGDQGGLTIHTRMKWFGGSTTVVKSTAFQVQTPQAGEFAWRGMDARLDLGRNYGSQSVSLDAPGLTFKGPTADVSVGSLKFNSDMQLMFDALNVGTAHLALTDIDIEEKAKDFKLTLQSLAIDTQSRATGEYVNTDFTFGGDALQTRKFSATRLSYDVHLDHIHGPSAAKLTTAVRAAQTEAANSSPPVDAGPKILEAFKTSGIDILLHDPVLDVEHTGFTTPDGEFVLSIKAALPGITRDDVSVNPELLLAATLKFLQASVDVRIDTALLDKLLDSSGKGDTITAQLQGLQRQGYIKLEGKALTTHLAYRSGQVKVNDLPFPPMPAAMPGGPGMPGPGMRGPGMPDPGMPVAPGTPAPGAPLAPGKPHAPAAAPH
jgi:uncharacterized protein YdgA (DUF945 family)